MLIVVAGASGRLGMRVCAELKKHKAPSLALVRSKEAAAKLPARTPFKVVDYHDVEHLRSVLKDASHIVNCTGLIDEDAGGKRLYEANVLPTRHLLQASPPALRRFVHMSSISVYGPWTGERQVNEFTPRRPFGAYGRSKLVAEREVMDWAHRHPAVVLQPGMIYGPEFEEGFWPMLKQLQKGRAKLIGTGENVLPLVHVQDVVNGILRALTIQVPSGSVFLLVSEERVSQKQAMDAAAKLLGVNGPQEKMDVGPAWGLAHAYALLSRLKGKKPSFTPSMVLQLSSNRMFDAHRSRQFLHWRAAITFKEGLAQVIAQYNASSTKT